MNRRKLGGLLGEPSLLGLIMRVKAAGSLTSQAMAPPWPRTLASPRVQPSSHVFVLFFP